jgi:hypothetical protein
MKEFDLAWVMVFCCPCPWQDDGPQKELCFYECFISYPALPLILPVRLSCGDGIPTIDTRLWMFLLLCIVYIIVIFVINPVNTTWHQIWGCYSKTNFLIICTRLIRMKHSYKVLKTKLRGLSLRANYTDLKAKLVPTFAARGCRVVSATDPQDRILG